MSCVDTRDFCVAAGETFMPVIRWATEELAGIPITAISQTAPAAITAIGHALPPDWDAAVVSAQGMTQINATRYPPKGADWHAVTVLNPDTVAFNDINSADFSTYTVGGFLVYYIPMNLTGITASMVIRDAPGATAPILATLTDALGGIVIDLVNKTIVPRLETASLNWNTGYYTLAMTDANAVVVDLITGVITIE